MIFGNLVALSWGPILAFGGLIGGLIRGAYWGILPSSLARSPLTSTKYFSPNLEVIAVLIGD